MQPTLIEQFFRCLSLEWPDPKTELNYINNFTLLVAVVLSAQATDRGVNKVTPALFKIAPTPEDMLELGLTKLKQHIKTIGLFNTKANNIMRLSKILVDQYQGKVPATRLDLEKLPGVGPKTASVVLNIAFGQNTIAVDTHVFRVANRTGLVKAHSPSETEKALMKVIPELWKRHAHHWLILHGRYTCKARSPLCGKCVVYELCSFKDKTKFAALTKG